MHVGFQTNLGHVLIVQPLDTPCHEIDGDRRLSIYGHGAFGGLLDGRTGTLDELKVSCFVEIPSPKIPRAMGRAVRRCSGVETSATIPVTPLHASAEGLQCSGRRELDLWTWMMNTPSVPVPCHQDARQALLQAYGTGNCIQTPANKDVPYGAVSVISSLCWTVCRCSAVQAVLGCKVVTS
jgi:hypothetical protein